MPLFLYCGIKFADSLSTLS